MQAAQHLGTDIKSLQRDKVSLKSVLEYLPHVAAHYSKRLPGDLEAGIRHQKLSSVMYRWEPGLELISIQGKYDSFRTKLLKAWHHQVPKACRGRGPPAYLSYLDRGKRMFPILEAAVQDMHVDQEGVWSENCGRGVGRVLGWLPLLSRLNALKHGKPGPKGSHKGALHLGANSEVYTWLPEGAAAVHAKLALMAEAGDALQASLASLPATADKWVASYKEFEAAPSLQPFSQSYSFSAIEPI